MITVGLIGCGFMGGMHANCYRALEGVTVTAVADIRPDKAATLAAMSDAAIYRDGMDLIQHANVDIIDICLPTFLHTKYALAAMDKVSYVFIEKPVALTDDECEALLAKQAETGCQIQVGQVIRFWDEYVKLKEFVDNKTFGDVVHASFKRLSPRPDWGWEDWLLDSARSGGAAQDLHIHDVDFVLSLFGLPTSSHSIVNTRSEERSFMSTHLVYDGFAVNTESTWDLPAAYPFTAAFRMVFEKATVENSGGRFLLYTTEGASEIKMDKITLANSEQSGNISDLGGYYKELLYFTNQAKIRATIEKATLSDAVISLRFLLGQAH